MPAVVWFAILVIVVFFWVEPEKASRDLNQWWTKMENGGDHN